MLSIAHKTAKLATSVGLTQKVYQRWLNLPELDQAKAEIAL